LQTNQHQIHVNPDFGMIDSNQDCKSNAVMRCQIIEGNWDDVFNLINQSYHEYCQGSSKCGN
jgi:hypothetical protein